MAWALAVLVTASCAPAAQEPGISAQSYLEAAIGVLDRGIRADSPEWGVATREARAAISETSSVEDVHALLDHLAVVAGGPHSWFRTPQEVQAWEAAATGVDGPALPSVVVEDGIGVLTVPAFALDDADLVQRYVDAGIAAVKPYTEVDLCGWVVDLSLNSGGNAHAMLAAVSPLLTDGVVMRSQERASPAVEIVVDGNTVLGAGQVLASGGEEVVKLNPTSVAVRHSGMTASAGEAVVIAFYGEPAARSFGQWTRGFTTGNDFVELGDGAGLTVTVRTFQDRLGTMYDGKLGPGVEGAGAAVGQSPGLTEEEWLLSRCAE